MINNSLPKKYGVVAVTQSMTGGGGAEVAAAPGTRRWAMIVFLTEEKVCIACALHEESYIDKHVQSAKTSVL